MCIMDNELLTLKTCDGSNYITWTSSELPYTSNLLVDTIKIDSSSSISSNYGSITNINTIDQMDKLYLYLSNGKTCVATKAPVWNNTAGYFFHAKGCHVLYISGDMAAKDLFRNYGVPSELFEKACFVMSEFNSYILCEGTRLIDIVSNNSSKNRKDFIYKPRKK